MIVERTKQQIIDNSDYNYIFLLFKEHLKMNKIEKFKRNIQEAKRNCFLQTIRINKEQFYHESSEIIQKMKTGQTQTSTTLFPIIISNNPELSQKDTLSIRTFEDQQTGILAPKFQSLGSYVERKDKLTNHGAFRRSSGKNQITAKNVDQLIAKSIIPSIRINKVRQNSQIKRSRNINYSEKKNYQIKLDKSINEQSKQSPPKKKTYIGKVWYNQTRKHTLLIENRSMKCRKISICPWDIPQDLSPTKF